MTRETRLVASAMLVMTALLAGCQSQQPTSPTPHAPAGPMHEGYHRPRNPYFLPKPILALESDEMRQLAVQSGEIPGERPLAWYDTRNDAQLTVQAGYQTSTLESVYTQTYDRQYQHGGTVRDHYSQWTRKSSVRETVR